ncbi:hypothetical protein ES288_D11G124800v1 [Gossypium darwinii]|uniref:Uncharacterized protein n=1 Tax=Gossypium darwinii TaxID=34276 RepID=A0A5D2AJ52_GOSDA|nr:hypothetical protein ES288_D11G124800v1 [Gossypium darwinii]
MTLVDSESMASLILLAKALMIRCQNHDLLSNKVEIEDSNHDVRHQGCIWMPTGKEEDAHTWKIAHHPCIWP